MADSEMIHEVVDMLAEDTLNVLVGKAMDN